MTFSQHCICVTCVFVFFFFFNDTATTEIYTLSLHDTLPIYLHGPFVVISASGMCEAGRILHHLRNNIEDPRNTVLITGFQAQDTLGRKLVEKWPEVRIFGE